MSQEVPPDEVLSLGQQIVLAIFPKFSSLLSVTGSSLIAYQILVSQRRERLAKPYHRLVLGMSICDMTASTAWFFSTWAIPASSSSQSWGASGTVGTCTAQGFFAQFSIATVMYNASLATYYTIVTGVVRVKQKKAIDTVKQFEPFLHVNALFWGLGTAVASIALELFNSTGWDCWIGAEPPGCIESWQANPGETGTCTRGDNATLYIWVFYYMPLWIVIVYATVTMWIINARIRKTERETGDIGITGENNVGILGVGPERGTNSHRGGRGSLVSLPGGKDVEEEKNQLVDASSHRVREDENAEDQDVERVGQMGSILRHSPPDAPRSGRGNVSFNIAQSTPGATKRKKHSRKVAQQSLYYLAVFYITWFWPSVFQIYMSVTGALGGRNFQTVFILNFLSAMCVPIQGFLNLIVYQRPAFQRYCKSHPDKSKVKCWFITLGHELGYWSNSTNVDLYSAVSSLQHMPIVNSRGVLPQDHYFPGNTREGDESTDDQSNNVASQNNAREEHAPPRALTMSWFRAIRRG